MKLHLAALSLGAALRPDCSVRDARPAGRRTRVRRVAQRLVRGVRHVRASVARRPIGDSRRPNPRPAARSRGPSLPPRAASQGDLAHGAPPLSRLPLEGSNLDYLIQRGRLNPLNSSNLRYPTRARVTRCLSSRGLVREIARLCSHTYECSSHKRSVPDCLAGLRCVPGERPRRQAHLAANCVQSIFSRNSDAMNLEARCCGSPRP